MLRRILLVLAAGALVVCGGCGIVAVRLWNRAGLSTAGAVDFVRPLAVPPLAPSRVDAEGRRVFDLRAAAGNHDFGAGPVHTWGFNGGYLGPTLRAARGERVLVNVRNDLPEPTSVHWHGMHLPAAMDGGPHQPIAPGTTWSPAWRVDQPAATLWYHPHGATAAHVYRGLAGLFIVDDPASTVDLPRRYGVDDVPVVVQDKRFRRGGGGRGGGGRGGGARLDEGESVLGGVGILGDTVTVNGTLAPFLAVSTERVRLRLLNASNGRMYQFGFADDREFALVGTDGGLLAAPFATRRIALAPGERAEIVVTVRPGERAVLRSTPSSYGLDFFQRHFSGAEDTLDVLQLRAADALAPSPPLPARLADVPRLDPAGAERRRSFNLSGHRIGGRDFDPARADAVVVKDTTEVWRVVNEDGRPHSLHVHDVQFQVASVRGAPPPPQLAGWKDTVFLPPGVPVEIVLRFADYADPGTPYMFHCHMLRHEDRGMMGQFVVVERGQQPGPFHTHHNHTGR